MHFSRTVDAEYIRETISHPAIWPYIGDDFSPDRATYQAPVSDNVYYIRVTDDDLSDLGLFILVAQSNVMADFHICLSPNSWGDRAKQAGREIFDWVWNNTPFRRIIASVPEYNPRAVMFLLRSGMKAFGVNAKSVQKGGKMMDQTCFGISKPEVSS